MNERIRKFLDELSTPLLVFYCSVIFQLGACAGISTISIWEKLDVQFDVKWEEEEP